MDYPELDILLDKYWLGETTLKEEQQLRETLAQSDLPDRYQQVANVFSYYDQASTIKMNNKPETFTIPTQASRWYEKDWIRWSSVAATIAMLLGIGYFLLNSDREFQQQTGGVQQVSEDTFENPDLAYQQAKEALLFLSQKLNTGLQYGSELKRLEEIDTKTDTNE